MPFKKSANPKSARFVMRMTLEDKRLIEERARANNQSVSEFVLKAGLARKTISKEDQQLREELRGVQDLIRAFYACNLEQREIQFPSLLQYSMSVIDKVALRPCSRFR